MSIMKIIFKDCLKTIFKKLFDIFLRVYIKVCNIFFTKSFHLTFVNIFLIVLFRTQR